MSWSRAVSGWRQNAVAKDVAKSLGFEMEPWSRTSECEFPISVFRLDLFQASTGCFSPLKRGLWRYPVSDGANIKFLDISFAKDLSSHEAVLREAELMAAIWTALNDAAVFSQTRRKHFELHMFEVPDLCLSSIWLRHQKEEWFLPFGAGIDNPVGIRGDEYTDDVVGKAAARRREISSLSVEEVPVFDADI